jgi:uncharacterized protein YutE (UPF0331/DUF86 family)
LVIDREAIAARLRRLDECVADLRRFRPASLSAYLEDHRTQAACERNLQVAIQCALDIGNHIIAEENLPPPEDQVDIFRILGSAAVLPGEFARRIAPMAGFRNILVHGYLRIDRAKVYTVLTEQLGDLDAFARHVQAWLDRKR